MSSAGAHREVGGRTRRSCHGLCAAASAVALAMAASASVCAAESPSPRPAAPASAASAASAAKDERIKQAKALNEEAEELYSHGQYRAAIAKLEEARKLDPDGKVLVYNLAVAHERLAEFEAAEKYYRRYLPMESDPKTRERVEGVLLRIEGAKQESASKPAPPPPPLKPAERTVEPWMFAAGAASLALGVGAGVGIAAAVTNPGASAKTGPGVSVDDLTRAAQLAHREAVAADISFLISAAAAGAAVYLYLRPPSAASQAAPKVAAPKVAVGISLGRAALQVVF